MTPMALHEHPIVGGVAGAVILAAVLVALWLALPLSGRSEHAVSHLALGVPVALLVVLAVKTWPAPVSGLPASLARKLLLVGLAFLGGGQLIEAIGAFGYDDYDVRNGLAVFHEMGVLIGPLGIVLTMAGAIASFGVALAARRGAAGSHYVSAAVVLAAVAAVAFVVGAVIFGY